MKRENHLNAIFQNTIHPKNISIEHIEQLERLTREYIQNKITEIQLMHFSDYSTAMKVFKDMYNKLEMEKANIAKQAYEKAQADLMNSSKLILKRESSQSVKGLKKKSKDSNVSLPKRSTDKMNHTKMSGTSLKHDGE